MTDTPCRVSRDLRDFEAKQDRLEAASNAAEAWAEEMVNAGDWEMDEFLEAVEAASLDVQAELVVGMRMNILSQCREALVDYFTKKRLDGEF